MAEQKRSESGAEGQKAAEEAFGSLPDRGSVADQRALAAASEETELTADEREKRAAAKRGAPQDAMEDYSENVAWLMDNRADDRVALHERDPLHPGGEVLFAAGVPRRAYLTPAVQHLLQTGELMPVPEPKKTVNVWSEEDGEYIEIPNPVHNPPVAQMGEERAGQPGRPVSLGRNYIDPQMFESSDMKQIRQRQGALPTYVPIAPGGTVPPDVQRENDEAMRRGGARR